MSTTDYTDDLRLAHVLADDADSISGSRFRSSQPDREEYDREASSSRRTSETWHRTALSSERPVQAPLPVDAHQHLVVDDERDQGRPHRYAADEVLGAVDGVDHPAALAVAGGSRLLTVDGVARPGAGEHPKLAPPIDPISTRPEPYCRC